MIPHIYDVEFVLQRCPLGSTYHARLPSAGHWLVARQLRGTRTAFRSIRVNVLLEPGFRATLLGVGLQLECVATEPQTANSVSTPLRLHAAEPFQRRRIDYCREPIETNARVLLKEGRRFRDEVRRVTCLYHRGSAPELAPLSRRCWVELVSSLARAPPKAPVARPAPPPKPRVARSVSAPPGRVDLVSSDSDAPEPPRQQPRSKRHIRDLVGSVKRRKMTSVVW